MNFNDRPDISPFDPNRMSSVSQPLPDEEAPLIGELPGLDISDLSLWADDRLSIYATLDAAMTKTIVEAVQSLTDLKRRVEEDAVARTLKIATDRDQVQREVERLQEERKNLQEQVAEAQRQVEIERTRKYNLEKECEVLLAETRASRDSLQQQIALLAQQMSQMQTFFEQRMAEWWENAAQNPNVKAAAPRPSNKPAPVDFSEKPTLAMRPVTPAPIREDEPTESRTVKDKLAGSNSRKNGKTTANISPANLIEFTEAPTPSIVPLVNGTSTAVLDKVTEIEMPAELDTELKAFSPHELEIDGALADPDITQDETQEIKAVEPPKRSNKTAEAEQRVQQFLKRRGTNPLPEDKQDATKSPATANQQAETAPAKKANGERNLLNELGEMLGLDVNTPPDRANMQFAEGYTPPPMPALNDKQLRQGRIEEIFKTPTPEPAHIGELSDNAIQWKEETLSQFITPPKSVKPEPPADERPTPPPSRQNVRSNYPMYPLKPPAAGSSKTSPDDAEAVSRVTISNLNGRSLLMMEKVVRSLPGVRHVTVTAFNKGELVMEVRHDAGAELDKIMPLQPELSSLKMIKHGPGELEFIQDSPKML